MAALVAQLQILKNDQQHLQDLCNQVELARADNAVLQRKSQTLPALQAEIERLKVMGRHRQSGCAKSEALNPYSCNKLCLSALPAGPHCQHSNAAARPFVPSCHVVAAPC